MQRVRWLADRDKTEAALSVLQDELDLPARPRRIECYDISTIQGTNTVASMVVFKDGSPRNQEYRRFRIKTVEGQDDFASMHEVLSRRFKRLAAQRGGERGSEGDSNGSEPPEEQEPAEQEIEDNEKPSPWDQAPDLVVIDGGKGQLSAALDALRNLGLGDIPVCGLAKREEEVFVADVDEPILLPRTSQALYLLQRVRDEAHRFAITYHRTLRGKAIRRSALDDVPGVGPKRKRALLRAFGSVQALRDASLEEIAAVEGVSGRLAETVKRAL